MALVHRERVLRAATSSFLAHGYRSSVDHIARRAGVAKQTVYHHFPSKDELFKEVARALAKNVLVELDSEPRELRAALVRFAHAYRKRALGAQGIATFRALVPEVPRFRALARAMYAGSAGVLVERLAEVLGRAMDAGELRRDDPALAAELLLGMLTGIDRVKRLFGLAADEGDPRRAERIVDCFLRAYTP
ncbi:MAG: TetR/AcrR family transcriptional regulator [Betaproteobacteria bacterium]|nr:MAG: TetR/AcrR family transcriptional regulator [Betaproteobacteria bacterium]